MIISTVSVRNAEPLKNFPRRVVRTIINIGGGKVETKEKTNLGPDCYIRTVTCGCGQQLRAIKYESGRIILWEFAGGGWFRHSCAYHMERKG